MWPFIRSTSGASCRARRPHSSIRLLQTLRTVCIRAPSGDWRWRLERSCSRRRFLPAIPFSRKAAAGAVVVEKGAEVVVESVAESVAAVVAGKGAAARHRVEHHPVEHLEEGTAVRPRAEPQAS